MHNEDRLLGSADVKLGVCPRHLDPQMGPFAWQEVGVRRVLARRFTTKAVKNGVRPQLTKPIDEPPEGSEPVCCRTSLSEHRPR